MGLYFMVWYERIFLYTQEREKDDVRDSCLHGSIYRRVDVPLHVGDGRGANQEHRALPGEGRRVGFRL